MRHTNNGLTLGVFVADQKPGRDQRIDKSRFRRRVRHVGEGSGALRHGLIAQAHRRQRPQHRRQCFLRFGRERVDHFIGPPGDRSFKAAERPIGGKGEKPPLASGLVERIEHEFEERQRSGIGGRRLLQHVIEPSPISVLLETQDRRRAPARG